MTGRRYAPLINLNKTKELRERFEFIYQLFKQITNSVFVQKAGVKQTKQRKKSITSPILSNKSLLY